MIICEGPDGGGKSTLARKIASELNLQIAPRVVGADTKAMLDIKHWTEENVRQGFQPLVYDRHRLISEPIYGPILRNRAEPGFDSPVWMTRMMLQFYVTCKPVIVYAIPPLDIVKKNVIEGVDDNSVPAPHIEKIYSAYCARMAVDFAAGNGLCYDYTTDSLFGLMGTVKTLYRLRSKHARH